MAKSILKGFRNLELGTKELLADIDSPLKLALKVLQISYDDFATEYLTVDAILACLETADVSIKQIKITNALCSADKKINRKVFDEGVKYKITILGRRHIEGLTIDNKLTLVYVEAN